MAPPPSGFKNKKGVQLLIRTENGVKKFHYIKNNILFRELRSTGTYSEGKPSRAAVSEDKLVGFRHTALGNSRSADRAS